MQASRDENKVTSGLAWDGTQTRQLKVDPVTDRLLIEIITVTNTVPVIGENALHDENHVPTALAYDGTEDKPLLIDNRNGLLFADVIIE